MLKIIILVTCLATVNAYLSHEPTIISPPNYGHHAGTYGSYGHSAVGHSYNHVAGLPVGHSYSHVTGVAPYAHSKTIAPAPIVNPYPTASRHAINANYQSDYAHSGYSHAAASSYVPPPVISPPTVTYNHNVIPPSVQTVNHPTPAAIHYPHQAQAINYHPRYSVPYSSPVYTHGPMYQNHVNYGW